ncbi:MAG: GNAT family N-acetyltransferase [Planctomycetota bacterium]|jgi:ribosomal protein S18 acetylase RimI-like enzyme
MNIEIQELDPEAYDALIALWDRAGLSYRPRGRDTRESIVENMRRDPDLYLGAVESGNLIGAVIASDEGRKGWINRLAVDPDYQRRGIGRRLVAEAEARLRARGREIIAILVEDWNEGSLAFFQAVGYALNRSILYLSKREGDWV